jgi:hypothetical protein
MSLSSISILVSGGNLKIIAWEPSGVSRQLGTRKSVVVGVIYLNFETAHSYKKISQITERLKLCCKYGNHTMKFLISHSTVQICVKELIYRMILYLSMWFGNYRIYVWECC